MLLLVLEWAANLAVLISVVYLLQVARSRSERRRQERAQDMSPEAPDPEQPRAP